MNYVIEKLSLVDMSERTLRVVRTEREALEYLEGYMLAVCKKYQGTGHIYKDSDGTYIGEITTSKGDLEYHARQQYRDEDLTEWL